MPKQDYYAKMGIEPAMTLEEVAVALAEEEGSDKPLTRQGIRRIEQSALNKIRNDPKARAVFELYFKDTLTEVY
jgi:DNA-directed RNA polymerase sigma subunit (sigma70/sigma32)